MKAKFYDVVVRTDVGSVDVAWSQKEDTDDDLKRLNLARSRELKQLKDEFKDILDEARRQPSAAEEEVRAAARRRAGPDREQPRQGRRRSRVRPIGTTARRRRPRSRPVKPDEKKKPDPSGPKKGGSK